MRFITTLVLLELIFLFVNTNIHESKDKINEYSLNNMVKHIENIRKLLRSLEEDNTDESAYENESGDDGESEPGDRESQESDESTEESTPESSEDEHTQSEEKESSTPVSPSGSGNSQPSGSGNTQPSGSGNSQPSGSGNTKPSGSGNTQPSGSGNTKPSGSGNTKPSGSGNTQPSGSGNTQPSGSGNTKPSGSINTKPSGSGNTQPSGSGNIQPSGSGNTQPSGSGNTKPSGSGNTKPSGSGNTKPSGSGNTKPSGSGNTQPSGSGNTQPSGSGNTQPSGSGNTKPSGSGNTQPSGSGNTQPSGSSPAKSSDGNSTSSSTSSSSASSSSSQSQTPADPDAPVTILTTAPVPRSKREAPVKLLTFHSFSAPRAAVKITFTTVFFFPGLPPKFISFTLNLHVRSSFRNLQGDDTGVNTTSNCTIDPADELKVGQNVNYNCEAPKKPNEEYDQVVVIPDIVVDGKELSLDELSYSEEAYVAAGALQKQTKVITKVLTLQNGQLTNNYPKNFIIQGDIKDFNGKKGDDQYYIEFTNSDESKSMVSCSIDSIVGEQYTFKCVPEKTINGTLYLAQLFDPDTNNSITLNMTQGNDNINFIVDPATTPSTPDSTRIYNAANYRKNSSGLSGGAIAGIVIACAVVLIIGSVIAMMLRKPSKAPLDNSTSVVGLRTVDNYTQ